MTLLNEQPLPSFERPLQASMGNLTSNDERKLTQLHCKEEIIKWLISVLLIDSSPTSPSTNNFSLATSGLGASLQSDQFSNGSSSAIGTLVAGFDLNSNYSNRTNDSDTL